MNGHRDVDVLVIGAGPAGLAAGVAVTKAGKTVLVLESGAALEFRHRTDPFKVTSGVGGAGLYSDGKFSFYPSASKLWNLDNASIVRGSYDWVASLLQPLGVSAPSLELATQAVIEAGSITEKRYPSIYASFEKRVELIDLLAASLGEGLQTASSPQHLGVKGGAWHCRYTNGSGLSRSASASAVVFAGGRFGPFALRGLRPSAEFRFRDVEIGFRLEQPDQEFFLACSQQVDPKLLTVERDGCSVRTFCCCRSGEVILSCTSGLWSLSGRADGASTGRSNVGINLRVSSEPMGQEILSKLLPAISGDEFSPVRESLKLFLQSARNGGGESGIHRLLGATASSALAEGIRQLAGLIPGIESTSAILWAPVVERVGFYPVLDNNLRLASEKFWVAGDSTGLFRGLTAALISGHYCGTMASH